MANNFQVKAVVKTDKYHVEFELIQPFKANDDFALSAKYFSIVDGGLILEEERAFLPGFMSCKLNENIFEKLVEVTEQLGNGNVIPEKIEFDVNVSSGDFHSKGKISFLYADDIVASFIAVESGEEETQEQLCSSDLEKNKTSSHKVLTAPRRAVTKIQKVKHMITHHERNGERFYGNGNCN